jgi:DNA-binding MarR family transcriptional regulator
MQTNKELAFELQNVISQLCKANLIKHNHSQLKGAEKQVLFLICELKNGQPATISEIANKIGVTLAAITHQINTLEKQGLIKRISDKADRRIVLVELTGKGHAQMVKLKKEFAKKILVLTQFLGEDDTKDLVRLIKKMADFPGFNDK